MAETKPTKVARWATDATRTLEPAAGEKDTGWQVGDKPPARKMNWLQNIAYSWFNWLNERVFDGAAAKDLEVTGVDLTGTDEDGGDLTLSGGDATGDGSSDVEIKAAIAGAAGAAARVAETFIKLDGATGLLNAVKAWVGSGAGGGLEATGGATSGPGMKGTGGGPNGTGHVGIGTGSGAGVRGESTDGHAIVAESNSATPIAKSALRIIPQDVDPTTAPARGDTYVNSVDGKLYIYNNAVWIPYIGQIYTSITASTAITAVGEQMFDRSYTFPANTLRVGTVIRIRALINCTINGTGNITARLRLGGVAGEIIALTATYATDAIDILLESFVVVRSLGAAGAIWLSGMTTRIDTPPVLYGASSGTTIDTTGALEIGATVNYTVNDNSAQLEQLVVDIA